MKKITINATGRTFKSYAELFRECRKDNTILPEFIGKTELNLHYYVQSNPDKFTVGGSENCSMKRISPITKKRINVISEPGTAYPSTPEVIEHLKSDIFEYINKMFPNARSSNIVFAIKGTNIVFDSVTDFARSFLFFDGAKLNSIEVGVHRSCTFHRKISYRSSYRYQIGYHDQEFVYCTDLPKSYYEALYKEVRAKGYYKYLKYRDEVLIPEFLKSFFMASCDPKTSETKALEFLKENNFFYKKKLKVIDPKAEKGYNCSNNNWTYYLKKKASSTHAATTPMILPTSALPSAASSITSMASTMSSITLYKFAEAFKSLADDAKASGK